MNSHVTSIMQNTLFAVCAIILFFLYKNLFFNCFCSYRHQLIITLYS